MPAFDRAKALLQRRRRREEEETRRSMRSLVTDGNAQTDSGAGDAGDGDESSSSSSSAAGAAAAAARTLRATPAHGADPSDEGDDERKSDGRVGTAALRTPEADVSHPGGVSIGQAVVERPSASEFPWPLAEMASYEYGSHAGDEDGEGGHEGVVVVVDLPRVSSSRVSKLKTLLSKFLFADGVRERDFEQGIEIPVDARSGLVKGVAFVRCGSESAAAATAARADTVALDGWMLRARRLSDYNPAEERGPGDDGGGAAADVSNVGSAQVADDSHSIGGATATEDDDDYSVLSDTEGEEAGRASEAESWNGSQVESAEHSSESKGTDGGPDEYATVAARSIKLFAKTARELKVAIEQGEQHRSGGGVAQHSEAADGGVGAHPSPGKLGVENQVIGGDEATHQIGVLLSRVRTLEKERAQLASRVHRSEARASRAAAMRVRLEADLEDLKASVAGMTRMQRRRQEMEAQQDRVISGLRLAKRQLQEDREELRAAIARLEAARETEGTAMAVLSRRLEEVRARVGAVLPFLLNDESKDPEAEARLRRALSGGWLGGDVADGGAGGADGTSCGAFALPTDDDELEAAEKQLEGALARVRRQKVSMLSQRARAAEAEAESRKEQRLCVVCLQREKSAVLRPCGHACCCGTCARREELRRCPVCRSDIAHVLDIYI